MAINRRRITTGVALAVAGLLPFVWGSLDALGWNVIVNMGKLDGILVLGGMLTMLAGGGVISEEIDRSDIEKQLNALEIDFNEMLKGNESAYSPEECLKYLENEENFPVECHEWPQYINLYRTIKLIYDKSQLPLTPTSNSYREIGLFIGNSSEADKESPNLQKVVKIPGFDPISALSLSSGNFASNEEDENSKNDKYIGP
jgi:hypothetical protein